MADPITPDNSDKDPLNKEERKRFKKRLDELGEKLDTVKKDGEPEKATHSGGTGMAIAMRMGSEFIVAVLIGGAIGWQLDRWLDTTPFLLFIFIMFGFAAGMQNIIRVGKGITALEAAKRSERNKGLDGPTDKD